MGKVKTKDERQKVPLLCLKQTVLLGLCQSPHQDGGEFLCPNFRGEETKAQGGWNGGFCTPMFESVCWSPGQLLLLEGSEGPGIREALRSRAYCIRSEPVRVEGPWSKSVTCSQCDGGQAKESPLRKESEDTEEGTIGHVALTCLLSIPAWSSVPITCPQSYDISYSLCPFNMGGGGCSL